MGRHGGKPCGPCETAANWCMTSLSAGQGSCGVVVSDLDGPYSWQKYATSFLLIMRRKAPFETGANDSPWKQICFPSRLNSMDIAF